MSTLIVSGGFIGYGAPDKPVRLPDGWTLLDIADAVRKIEPAAVRVGFASKFGRDELAAVVYVVDWRGSDIHGATDIGSGFMCLRGQKKSQSSAWRVRPLGEPEPYRWSVKVDGGMPVEVVAVERDTNGVTGPWGGLSGAELAAAFRAFDRLTGCAWSCSIGVTAENVIQRHGGQIPRGTRLPDPARDPAVEMPSNWARELSAAETSRRWVHAFDQNSQYLGAWGVTPLGIGEPVERFTFDHTGQSGFPPGLYRIASDSFGPWLKAANSSALPPCWTPGREWFAGATVARMHEWGERYGLTFTPLSAWLWPRSRRVLEHPAEVLAKARDSARATEIESLEELAGAVEPAAGELLHRAVIAGAVLDAVKACYRVGTGRLAMFREGSPWWRPDWAAEVKAMARVNLHRRLEGLSARPFAVATDGLLFASDERDGRKFATACGLPVGPRLGQFSYDGTAPMSALSGSKVLDMFRSVHEGVVE